MIESKIKVGKNLFLSPMGCGTWAWGNRFLWGYDPSMDNQLQQVFNLHVSQGIAAAPPRRLQPVSASQSDWTWRHYPTLAGDMRYFFNARPAPLWLAGSRLQVRCNCWESRSLHPKKNLPGAPGRITLRYLAAAGSARLELVYHRPWEADTPPVATFSVAVVVK